MHILSSFLEREQKVRLPNALRELSQFNISSQWGPGGVRGVSGEEQLGNVEGTFIPGPQKRESG